MDSQQRSRVFLTLGSNLSPEQNLPAAIQLLNSTADVRVVKVSQVWESAPVGFLNQPAFCNAAVLIETCRSPRELKFSVLRQIEDRLGRVRDPANKNGPRTIDLDIGFFGNSVIAEENLIIPDPDIPQREFLATPLAELDADYVHPVLGQTLAELAASIRTPGCLIRRPDLILKTGNFF